MGMPTDTEVDMPPADDMPTDEEVDVPPADDMPTDEPTESSSSSSSSSTSTTKTTTPEPTTLGSGFSIAAEGQVLESTGGSNNEANSGDNVSSFEKYKLPLIIVGSVLSGVLATLGAVAGIKIPRRNAASKSNYADMQNAESVV